MALIMIVEDEEVTIKILASYVERMGHIPVKFRDGLSAWNFLQENSDIVGALITDLVMPEMDGYSLIDKIRGHEKTVELPIIVQSDYLGVKGTVVLMEKGASVVYPKPLNFEDLKGHILEFIKE